MGWLILAAVAILLYAIGYRAGVARSFEETRRGTSSRPSSRPGRPCVVPPRSTAADASKDRRCGDPRSNRRDGPEQPLDPSPAREPHGYEGEDDPQDGERRSRSNDACADRSLNKH